MRASILVKTPLIIAEPFQAGEYGGELRVGEKQPSCNTLLINTFPQQRLLEQGTTTKQMFVPTIVVGTTAREMIVPTMIVGTVVPKMIVGTAVPTIIVLMAYYWKSCVWGGWRSWK